MKRRRSYLKPRTDLSFFSPCKTTLLIAAITAICPFSALDAVAATGTINFNDPCQQIEGFGGAACYEAQSLPSHPDKETIYDLLFRDLGLDVLRIKNTYEISAGDVNATGQIVSAARQPGRNPNLKTFLVPWSPAAYLKSDGYVGGPEHYNGTLKKDANDPNNSAPHYYVYKAYANWWAHSITAFEANNIHPDYISIQNEPDWGIQDQECRFDPTENSIYAGYDKAFEAVYNRMDGNVSPMPKVLAPETMGFGGSQAYIGALDDRGQLDRVYGFSHHLYSDGSYDNPDGMIQAMQIYAQNYGYKPLFQTEYGPEGTPTFEHAVLLAQHIHNCLVYEGVTSYHHWSLFRGWGGGGMINIEGGTYEVRKLYWFFKHFAYFTDPNWYRINATPTPSTNLRMTAFKDPNDSRLTIVILNKSGSSESLTLTIDGFPPSGSAFFSEVYQTTSDVNFAYIGAFDPAQSLSLPAESITTINMVGCLGSSRWQSLNSQMDSDVWALTVYDGELIAGGGFTTAGGVTANRIARWNGSSWQPLGSGINGPVYALTVYDGNLIAGGEFTSPANHIARWNGGSWQPLGSGLSDLMLALTVYNGELIAGGFFGEAGGSTVNFIARWNGSSWQPLGSGMEDGVFALTVYNGELVAGGFFSTAGGSTVNFVARWNGSNWQPLGSGMNSAVYALGVYNGELVAAGDFTMAGGSDANHIARWNGSSWQPLGSGVDSYDYLDDLTVYNGELIAGGVFTTAGGVAAKRIARWNGSNWQPLGSGMDGEVTGLTVYNGELIAGGAFTTAGGIDSPHVAGWGLVIKYMGDLNHDCVVDWFDVKWLADKWLDEDCLYTGWCYEADLNYDFTVNFEDFAKLGNNWLEGL